MRLLLPSPTAGGPPQTLSEADLEALYAWPQGGGVRANFVSTLDGSVAGPDGRSGSINTPADNRVFALQRTLADCVLVGAGTARAEGYRSGAVPLIVVSQRGQLPETLTQGSGSVILLTCARSGVEESERVWIHGTDTVDLPSAVSRLAESGMPRVLTEGGPSLFGSLLAAGLVDELALTWSPILCGSGGPRMITPTLDDPRAVAPRHLIEAAGTFLGLWAIVPGSH